MFGKVRRVYRVMACNCGMCSV